MEATKTSLPIDIAQEIFYAAFQRKNLCARPASASPADWDQVWTQATDSPALYAASWSTYFETYLSNEAPALSLSSVLYVDNRPIGIWPLYLHLLEGAWQPGSAGGFVAPPLFLNEVGERSVREAIEACIDSLNRISALLAIPGWSTQEICRSDLSLWHRKLASDGASFELGHELYLDLRPPLEKIRTCLRKSYRSLINQGNRLWKVELLDRDADSAMGEFRQLHARAAGRATRSLATWQAQSASIRGGHAFLIAIRDENGQMVGGALFGRSHCEGHYAVGAYDRSLFDKPLGHVIQMRAIEYLKERGASWYRIGDRPYPGTVPDATEKQLSIAYYKEGFASHHFPKLLSRVKAAR